MSAGDQVAFARSVSVRVMDGNYDGAALRQMPARSQALAMQDLPSRDGKRLRYRNGTVTDLQGQHLEGPRRDAGIAPTPAAVRPKTRSRNGANS